jgi:hypothetical protein
MPAAIKTCSQADYCSLLTLPSLHAHSVCCQIQVRVKILWYVQEMAEVWSGDQGQGQTAADLQPAAAEQNSGSLEELDSCRAEGQTHKLASSIVGLESGGEKQSSAAGGVAGEEAVERAGPVSD